jgi:mRNA interferase MazF
MPRVGDHPIVILTVNRLLQVLSSTTGVLVTGTPGPRSTHIALGAEAGLTRYGESYAVATELHNVPLIALRRQRGRLASGELRALEDAVRIAHGLTEVDL